MSNDSGAGRRQPRQSDIARVAGVSQWTVSVVINGTQGHRVPPDTQERVLAVARELGYTPNIAARSLRGSSNRLIGLFVYGPAFALAAQSRFNGFLVGVESAARRAGCDLVLFSSIASDPILDGDVAADESAEHSHVYRDGINRLNLADGSVIMGLEAERDELGRLARDGYRFVYIGRRDVPDVDLAYVTPDYRAAAVDAVDHLVAAGHRRLAYVAARQLGAKDDEPHQDRHDGYLAARRRHRLPDLSVGDSQLSHLDRPWMGTLRDQEITAVVVENQAGAERLAQLSRATRLRIPDQLSVVVLDSVVDGPRRGVPWSCTPVPREEIGSRAVSLLLELLPGVWPPPGGLPHELISCGAVTSGTIAEPRTAG